VSAARQPFPPFATAGFSIPQFSSVSRLSAGDFFVVRRALSVPFRGRGPRSGEGVQVHGFAAYFLFFFRSFAYSYFFIHFFVNFLPISLSFFPFVAADFKNIA
jgi:hypothetical protein